MSTDNYYITDEERAIIRKLNHFAYSEAYLERVLRSVGTEHYDITQYTGVLGFMAAVGCMAKLKKEQQERRRGQ